MSQPHSYRTLDDERSAQKRAELQLSPRRDTAKSTLRRPPSPRHGHNDAAGLIIFTLLLVFVATALLLLAQLFGISTSWASVRQETDRWFIQRVETPVASIAQPAPTDSLDPAAGSTATLTDTPTAMPTDAPTAPPTSTSVSTATSVAAVAAANTATPRPASTIRSTLSPTPPAEPPLAKPSSVDPSPVRMQPRWLTNLLAWRLPAINLGRSRARELGAVDAIVEGDSPLSGVLGDSYRLLRVDNFDGRAPLLVPVEQPGRNAAALTNERRYLARPEANQVLWITFEAEADGSSGESPQGAPLIAIETRALVEAQTPSGYVALIARHQDDDNLYLFLVDGRTASTQQRSGAIERMGGRFQIQLIQDGTWQIVQDWTASPALHSAGQPNVLALVDAPNAAGKPALQFFAGDGDSATLLYEVVQPALPPGRLGVGLGGGATGAQVSLEWLRLYGAAP